MIELRVVEAVEAAARAQARAEFATWSAVLDCHESNRAAIDAGDDPVLVKELQRRAVTTEISQRLHITENAVWRIVCLAERIRDRAPLTWQAFADGRIDASRAAAISDCLSKLETARAAERLDAIVVAYAETHTVGELRSWLKRFRARVEPEPTAAEAEAGVRERRVEFTHLDDGTSWINVLVPTVVAIAVENRVTRAARALPKHDADTGERDSRTIAQKQADLFAHWLTCSEGTRTDIRAEIAIAIDATDLIGYGQGAGHTRDLRHTIPAGWVIELAKSETTLFRRLVLDPAGQVLDTTSLGYQPPDELRRALHWRDGTCRVAGCERDAATTDLDHRLAHDRGGGTNGANLRCLCRKHHNLKSHGLLDERFVARPPTQREIWMDPFWFDDRIGLLTG